MKIRILEMLADGASYSTIVKEVGCSTATISYHAKKHGFSLGRSRKEYDWKSIRSYYDGGATVSECIDRFGFSRSSWTNAIANGKVVPRPYYRQDALRKHEQKLCSKTVKLAMKRAGSVNECALCGISQWSGQTLSLQLDHVNGDNTDNRPENIRLLCPNCHSQTPTFSGRNKGKKSSTGV